MRATFEHDRTNGAKEQKQGKACENEVAEKGAQARIKKCANISIELKVCEFRIYFCVELKVYECCVVVKSVRLLDSSHSEVSAYTVIVLPTSEYTTT